LHITQFGSGKLVYSQCRCFCLYIWSTIFTSSVAGTFPTPSDSPETRSISRDVVATFQDSAAVRLKSPLFCDIT